MDPNAIANQAMQGGKEQTAREVSVMLSANTGPYQKEMEAAAQQTNKLADALHKVDKAYTGTLKFIGRSTMGLGVAMQGAATGATWSAAQFEESFARVAKTTGLQNQLGGKTGRNVDFMATLGIGDNALQTFQNDIRALSTEIPVATQELAYLADVAGTLGVESENLVLFSDTAAKLGAAINDLGSDQAIAGLANLIGAFGRAETEVVNLGSSLADLANHTRGNASEILQFSDRLAGTAVQIGMTAEEVMGLGAAVSAIGAMPELGASAIVQTMNTIALAIQGAGSEAEKFARVMGMSANELETMWTEEGATAVLTKLLTVLNSQGEKAVSTLRALGLSGVGTTQILGGLSAQLGTYSHAMETSIEASEKGSAVAELAAVRFDTVYKAMQRFGQTTAEVFRSVGAGFLAPFKVLIDTMSGLVNVFNKIPQPVKTALGLFLGLGGAVAVAAGAFTIFFAQFHALFALIYIAPKVLELLKIGIEKLGPETARAVAHLEKLRLKLVSMTNFMANFPDRIRGIFRTISEKGLFGSIGAVFDSARQRVSAFWEAAVSPRVAGARASIVGVFDKIWPKITEGVRSARDAIKAFASGGIGFLRGSLEDLAPAFERLKDVLGEVFGGALRLVRRFGNELKVRFVEALPSIGEAFSNLRERVSGALSRIFGNVDVEGESIFQRLVKYARSGMDTLVAGIGGAMRRVREVISEGLATGLPIFRKWAREAALNMSTAFTFGMASMGMAIKRALLISLDAVGGVLTSVVPGIFDAVVKNIGRAVGNTAGALVALRDAALPALRLLGEMFATLAVRGMEAFRGILPALKDFGKTLLRYVGKGLETVGRAAKWVFKELFVKETLEVMATALKTMAWTARQAAKPFLMLGKNILEAMGRPALDAIASLRAGMASIATQGVAGSLATAFSALRIRLNELKASAAVTFPGIAAMMTGLRARVTMLGATLSATFGPMFANLMAGVRTQLAVLGMSFKMLLGPIGWIIAAVTAVGTAIWGWDAWKGRNDKVTDSLYAMAEAAGLVADEVERASWASANSNIDDFRMATTGKNVIGRLRSLPEDQAMDLTFSYAATLVAGGQNPETVVEHVNELRRLAGLGAIEFEYTMSEIRSGEGFEKWLEATSKSTSGLFSGMFGEKLDKSVPEFFGMTFLNKIPKQFEAAWDDNLQQLKAIADTNVVAAQAVFFDMTDEINRAVDNNIMSADMGRKLRRELADELGSIQAIATDEAGGIEKATAWLSQSLMALTAVATGGRVDARGQGGRVDDWIQSTLTGSASPQTALSNLLGNQDYEYAADLRPVRDLVTEITGEVRNLDDAVANMSTEEFALFRDRLREVALEIQNISVLKDIEQLDTRLERELSRGQQSLENPEDYERFEEHTLASYHHTVGHVQALREMEILQRKIIANSSPWSEEAARLRDAMGEVADEYAQIERQDLEQAINAAPAADRVQMVIDRLRELTNTPWDAQVRVEVREVLFQTYQQEEQRFRQTMQQYDQLIDQREETVRSHNERLEDMAEDHGRAMSRMEEGRVKSITRANEQYKDRLEDINKAEKKALEDRVEQQARAFNILQRVQATPTAGLGAMLNNMRAQNRAMEEMTQNVRKLEQMGLSTDVMEAIGLNDPKNFAQARRMVEMAVSDPSMINDINAAWSQRLDLSKAFVDEADTSQITDQFDEQRKAAKEALDKQVEDINKSHREQVADANENYGRQIESANENHQKQLEKIAENLAKLGEDTFKTIDELIESAAASGLEKLQEWAIEIERLRDALDTDWALETDQKIAQQFGLEYLEYDPEGFKGAGADAAEMIIVGWKGNAPYTWRELQRDIASGSGTAFSKIKDNTEDAVDDSFLLLDSFSRQSRIWDPATRETERGARSMVTGFTRELEAGTTQLDRIMGGWVGSIENHLNPVLESIGEDPIDINVTSSSGRSQAGGGRLLRRAQGGFLPDQATIQNPGTLVQWAEPETGGEAFIPLASSKRQRSKAIWEQTGRLLGIDMDRLDPHALHSYANGGFHDIPDMSELGTIGKATEQAMKYVYDLWMQSATTASAYDQRLGPGGPGGAASGWRQMWEVLSNAFPTANLHSGYRPGAITATGNRSYHGMGRAIDVTPSVDIANWIRRNFMAQTREMIYSPMNSKQVHNGRDHYYATPITRAQHWDHVHWAMAQGGQLTDKMKKGGDNIPAWLSNDEFIMQAEAVKEYGLEMMNAINARRFASGGLVGASSSRLRGREPNSGSTNMDLVNALTRALANAQMGRSETNHWDVKVEANDTRRMIKELERKKRLSRLTGGDTNR